MIPPALSLPLLRYHHLPLALPNSFPSPTLVFLIVAINWSWWFLFAHLSPQSLIYTSSRCFLSSLRSYFQLKSMFLHSPFPYPFHSQLTPLVFFLSPPPTSYVSFFHRSSFISYLSYLPFPCTPHSNTSSTPMCFNVTIKSDCIPDWEIGTNMRIKSCFIYYYFTY